MIFIPIIERITGVRVRYIDKACTFKLENGKTVLALPQEYGDIDYIPFFRNKYDIIIGHGPMSSINDELTKKIEIPTSGGLGGRLDGMLAVFGGNMMTKAAGWAAGLVDGMGDAIQQGIELAKAGEGVRIAFERLNRPDLLDNLREATHGTVTDIELMKQAVKFNDFKLSLDEMGTLLAFAQQKAKDTGQSVDYMVDSIVTGLGRQSLMILDNLGISANEVKEKMKGTGDMTKAVAEIIRDQMSKAGDYIETAADRAAKADAEVKNAMEELGRTFQPLADTGAQMWHSLKIGALDLLNSAVKPLIDNFTTLGKLRKQYEQAGGQTRVGSDLEKLGRNSSDTAYKVILGQYDREIRERERAYNAWHKWRSGDRSAATEAEVSWAKSNFGTDTAAINQGINAWKKMRAEFVEGAKNVMNPVIDVTTPTTTPTTTKSGRVGHVGSTVAPPPPEGSIAAQEAEIARLTTLWREATTQVGRDGYAGQLEAAKKTLSEMQGKVDDFLTATPVFDMNRGSEQMSIVDKIRTSISDSNIAADEAALSNILEHMMRNGIDTADFPADELYNKILGPGIPDEKWQEVVADINEKLANAGLEPIELDVKTGNITKVAKEVGASWQDAAHAVQAVGSALQSIQDPTAKILGIIGQAIANVALGFAQATTAESGKGIWAWIAAIAGGVGTMVSTISAIHSATGYSEGGIIKGTSYSGDNIMANGGTIGLNAGEIVLNRAQAVPRPAISHPPSPTPEQAQTAGRILMSRPSGSVWATT